MGGFEGYNALSAGKGLKGARLNPLRFTALEAPSVQGAVASR